MKHPTTDGALVYDLRHDPTPFLKMSVDQLIEVWRWNPDPEAVRLPVKTLKYNRCPAVAPLGVIKDQATQDRIQLPLKTVTKHLDILKQQHREFTRKILEAVERMNEAQDKEQVALVDNQLTVDERLYDGFIGDTDKQAMRVVRAAQPEELASFVDTLKDERLKNLLPLYKARNYPKDLSSEERAAWEDFVNKKLLSGGTESRAAKYFARLQELADTKLTKNQQYLLEELQLYGESILPGDVAG
jgi:exodeoxyribonuclease-1